MHKNHKESLGDVQDTSKELMEHLVHLVGGRAAPSDSPKPFLQEGLRGGGGEIEVSSHYQSMNQWQAGSYRWL